MAASPPPPREVHQLYKAPIEARSDCHSWPNWPWAPRLHARAARAAETIPAFRLLLDPRTRPLGVLNPITYCVGALAGSPKRRRRICSATVTGKLIPPSPVHAPRLALVKQSSKDYRVSRADGAFVRTGRTSRILATFLSDRKAKAVLRRDLIREAPSPWTTQH